jgi:GntR family carbon starvation induced transcriptional regulator
METTESLSHAERAYRRLRSEILYGDLMPGERLRAAELQDRFSLGLTPIREALMRLSSENLVEVDPNRGSRVSDASLAELADLMATRREIEKLCLTSAMTHGDTAWEGEIVAALHRLSRTPLPSSTDDREAATQWEAQHRSFHFALVSACQEKWLLRFWNILTDHSERYRKYRLLQRQESPAVPPLGAPPIYMVFDLYFPSLQAMQDALASPVRQTVRTQLAQVMTGFQGKVYHLVMQESATIP